ncbi:MAG: acyl-CoA thioesterase [Bacteroidales bacterium]|nr:acyl-CoA thioesterase [Bacteroidales bacterium]
MKLPIQIRFNDVDQMGHINNAVIMEYFDLGKSDYFGAVGIPPEQGEFTVVIVHLEVDFLNQIRYHDKIHLITHCEKIGNKSVTMLQQVVNSATGDICASCRTILSGYSRTTNTSAAIPESVKKEIFHFEETHKD